MLTVKAFTGYNLATGGAAPADLVPPTAPAPSSEAAGTTSVSLTWTAASGGTAPYSYNLTVVDEAGASVTPSSGSGLGPYVIPVADGKSYLATLSASDSGTPTQTASSSTLIQVAAAVVPDLLAAGPPGVSNPASGTTSVNLTWTAASGGVAPYSYGIAVVDEAGASVTPSSGSGLGPYAIPVADGKSYLATLTTTDNFGTPNVAKSSTMIQVGTPAPAPAWNLLTDVDLTGLDTLNISAVGTYTLTKSGSAFKTIQISRTGSTGATNTADTNGVTLDGPTSVAGTYQAAIDETTAVSLTGATTLVAADLAQPLALQIRCTVLESSGVNGNGAAVGVASNTGTPITSTIFQGIRLDSDGTNYDLDARVYRGSATDAPWVANIDTLGPKEALVTVILHYGNIAELWVDWGSSAYVTPRSENTGPAQAGGNVSSGPGFISSYNKFVTALAVIKSTSGTFKVTVAGYRIYRYG